MLGFPSGSDTLIFATRVHENQALSCMVPARTKEPTELRKAARNELYGIGQNMKQYSIMVRPVQMQNSRYMSMALARPGVFDRYPCFSWARSDGDGDGGAVGCDRLC